MFHGLGPLACSGLELISETMNLLDILVRLFGQGIRPSQDIYIHGTTQHREKCIYIHTSIGIRTHYLSVRKVQEHVP